MVGVLRSKKVSANIFGSWEQRHWVEIHQKKIERLLAVRTTDCFVDLGCGEDFYTIPISQKTNLCLGLDFSHNALRILCRQQDFNPGKLELTICFGDAIPLPEMVVDRLLCNHLLEHVIDDQSVVREICRILKPGGLALIGVPLALNPHFRLLLKLRRWLWPTARKVRLESVSPGQLVPELIGVQSHVRFYSLMALQEMVKENGFQVLKAEGIGFSIRGPWNRVIRRSSWLMLFFNILIFELI